MDGSCFQIMTDGPDSYIRVSDVLEILSSRYSPVDREQVATVLQSVIDADKNVRMH
jgi:hypothetical protein